MKKKVLKRVGITFAVLIILGAIGSSGSQKSETQNSVLNQKTEQSETKDPKEEIEVQKTYDVVKVVDGDTIDVDMDGKVQRIRLIGVNTPETVHPNKDVEYFGKEASEYTKQNLSGKKVSIETDDSQDRYDKYGRLLAYVFVDGKNFNKSLIENGYAYEYTYNVPYKYQSEFKTAQKTAEVENRGLWGPKKTENVAKKENQTPKTQKTTNTTSRKTQPAQQKAAPTSSTKQISQNNSGSTKKSATQTDSQAPSQNCDIKGNINNKGEKIYHVKNDASYKQTKIDPGRGERWFCSEQEARQAGWRRAER